MRCNGGDCGRLVAAPTFVDGHGGHPERDVEGAVPYEGGANPEKKRVSAVQWGRLRAAGSRPYREAVGAEDGGGRRAIREGIKV